MLLLPSTPRTGCAGTTGIRGLSHSTGNGVWQRMSCYRGRMLAVQTVVQDAPLRWLRLGAEWAWETRCDPCVARPLGVVLVRRRGSHNWEADVGGNVGLKDACRISGWRSRAAGFGDDRA